MKRALAILITALLILSLPLWLSACGRPRVSDEYVFTCTLTVECRSIFDHLDEFDKDKLEVLPEDGYILNEIVAGFNEGDTVYDVLRRETAARGVHMEASYTPAFGSSYIEGINNIYEFDCGPYSGWTYRVNGQYPQYGCSSYYLNDGDEIVWHYTCEYMEELDWADG